MPRRHEQVLVVLSREEFAELERQSKPACRDPYQHARFLLLQALKRGEQSALACPDAGGEEPATVAS